jgi:hypothetical protein
MAQVTYENLFSESRNNVVSLISNSSNVADPTLSSSEFRKWIYSRAPDVKASDFPGYPLIIINPVEVDIEEEGGTVDMKSKVVNWDVEIEIVTSDRGYGETNGKGLSHMDAISDDVVQTLMNKTNRVTLSNQSMKFTTPTTSAVTAETVQNELVYRRSIIVSFQSRIQVSA